MIDRLLAPLLLIACAQDAPQHAVQIEQPVDQPGEQAAAPPDTPAEPAHAIVAASVGQRLYVPVYSTVEFGTGIKKATVAVRLMVRNVSETQSLRLTRVDLYDSEGAQIEAVIRAPLVVKPLQTRSFLIDAEDLRAGAGGNFIVAWEADEAVIPPMIETVNGYSEANRTFAFRAGSRVLAERQPPAPTGAGPAAR